MIITPVVPPIVLAISKSPEIDKYDMLSIRVLKSEGAPLGKELDDTVRTKFPKALKKKFAEGTASPANDSVLL